uniref:Uncharacterized protein n=1 Tax=Wuchereria bancrofti TaxID=6293 RepID=A0AAF5Q056_WUCBA
MFTFSCAHISSAFTRHRKKKMMVLFPTDLVSSYPFFSLSIQINHMAHSKHPSSQSITPLAFI